MEYTDDDIDQLVMNYFYGLEQGVPAPAPSTQHPTTLNSVCTIVNSGPVYDRFCPSGMTEPEYPCLVYSCPGQPYLENRYNPEWKKHSESLTKYFNDNIKCSYETGIGPVGPAYKGVYHLRGTCFKKPDPNEIAP
jgi:hypothetical protein